jgi:hypothetical protein
MLALQESIRPSADLRNHYNEISKQCKENKEMVEVIRCPFHMKNIKI